MARQKGILAACCYCDLTQINGGKWIAIKQRVIKHLLIVSTHFLHKSLAGDFKIVRNVMDVTTRIHVELHYHVSSNAVLHTRRFLRGDVIQMQEETLAFTHMKLLYVLTTTL